MASIFDRLDKREAFPVALKRGEIYLREPTFADLQRIAQVSKTADADTSANELSSGLAVALCVVEKDGSIAFSPADGETDVELAGRVLAVIKEKLTPSDLVKIEEGIRKLTAAPNAEDLAKNS